MSTRPITMDELLQLNTVLQQENEHLRRRSGRPEVVISLDHAFVKRDWTDAELARLEATIISAADVPILRSDGTAVKIESNRRIMAHWLAWCVVDFVAFSVLFSLAALGLGGWVDAACFIVALIYKQAASRAVRADWASVKRIVRWWVNARRGQGGVG